MTIRYTNPVGDVVENPTLDDLRDIVTRLPTDYWGRGSGDAVLENERGASLGIFPNAKHGVHLKYYAPGDDEPWLSLGDRSRMAEVAEVSDEWYVSVGLFVPPADAWLAVDKFWRTGDRTDQIPWIRPDEVPEGGNF